MLSMLSILLWQADPSDTLLAILFNAGIIAVLVQLIKTKLLPILKEKAPWALPLIATVLGAVSGTILAKYGIDIGPIVGAFSGLLASGGYMVVRGAARGSK